MLSMNNMLSNNILMPGPIYFAMQLNGRTNSISSGAHTQHKCTNISEDNWYFWTIRKQSRTFTLSAILMVVRADTIIITFHRWRVFFNRFSTFQTTCSFAKSRLYSWFFLLIKRMTVEESTRNRLASQKQCESICWDIFVKNSSVSWLEVLAGGDYLN